MAPFLLVAPLLVILGAGLDTLATTNWGAVSAITAMVSLVVGIVGKLLSNKLDAVGDHLAAQDKAKESLIDRLSKVETKVEMLLRKR
jgi:hypothetical protein